MFTITELLIRLQRRPALTEALNLGQLVLFIDICCHIRPHLELQHPHLETFSPAELPHNVLLFLVSCLSTVGQGVSLSTIKTAWECVGALIWELPKRHAPPEVVPLILKHGTPLKIGKYRAVSV